MKKHFCFVLDGGHLSYHLRLYRLQDQSCASAILAKFAST